MTTPLSLEQISELLGPKPRESTQVGPLRWFDKEMRCASRGCSSPTYVKLQNVPRCMIHAVNEMNLMLVEAGFKGVQ
jgi:hypothetical protein